MFWGHGDSFLVSPRTLTRPGLFVVGSLVTLIRFFSTPAHQVCVCTLDDGAAADNTLKSAVSVTLTCGSVGLPMREEPRYLQQGPIGALPHDPTFAFLNSRHPARATHHAR